MVAESEKTHTNRTCAVEVTPGEIDAGADMTLVGTISSFPACDFTGQVLLINSREGALLGRAEIAEFDGEINRTSALVIKAPITTGEYTWSAVLPAHVTDGVSYEEASAPFSFTVKPHNTSLVVWDVPSTIVTGERFSIKVGVKCSSECRPIGWVLEIRDHEGTQLAIAVMRDELWPGTAALYFAEVELEAPGAEGLYKWKAKAPGSDLEIPHEERAAEFGVRIVTPPECLVRIEAIDKASQTPVKGAKVVVHPYRTFTDDRGVAEVRVSKGEYKIFVSGKKHIPFRTVGAVTADMTIRADLSVDVGLSEADIWS